MTGSGVHTCEAAMSVTRQRRGDAGHAVTQPRRKKGGAI